MTNAEILLRGILGPIRSSIRPLVLAVNITEELLFQQHFSMDDILVTKHVYSRAAEVMGKKVDAVSKSVERLAHLCWNAMVEQELVACYLGRELRHFPTPRDFLIYLAVYSYLHIPFFTAIEQYPRFLFQSPAEVERRDSGAPPEKSGERSRPVPVVERLADRPVCPVCMEVVGREGQNFCGHCGQRLDWTRYPFARVIEGKETDTVLASSCGG